MSDGNEPRNPGERGHGDHVPGEQGHTEHGHSEPAQAPPVRGEHVHDDQDIGCLQALEVFYAYLDGEIDDPQSIADFEHHLVHCKSCWSRTELEGLLTERLRAVAAEKAPEALKRRLRILFDHL